jgi:DNA-binding NtrC family response regulator
LIRLTPLVPDELREQLAQAERQRIVDALGRCGGNQTEAAVSLGISRRTLVKRLATFNIPRPRKRQGTEP